MNRHSQFRVVIVGRDISIAPIEQALLAEGASNYVCVPTLDAADWLFRDGFAADLLIVDEALLPSISDLDDLHRRLPQTALLQTSVLCDRGEVREALVAARRRREHSVSLARMTHVRRVPSFGERFAMG